MEGVQTTHPSRPPKNVFVLQFVFYHLQLIVITYLVVYKPVNSDSSSKFMVALTDVTMIIQPSTEAQKNHANVYLLY